MPSANLGEPVTERFELNFTATLTFSPAPYVLSEFGVDVKLTSVTSGTGWYTATVKSTESKSPSQSVAMSR